MRQAFESFMLAGLLGVAIAGTGCQSTSSTAHQSPNATSAESSATSASVETVQAADTAVLTVHGMGCPQCANNVDLQLLKVPGVKSVKIDMGSGRVTVGLGQQPRPTREQLAKAIEETGFTLVKIEMPAA